MPFTEVSRVIYRKNPLRQVVCQLRFPPLLRIDAELPAAFQDAIRREFPNLSETSEWRVEVPSALRSAIPPEVVSQMLQSSGSKNYEFSSEDNQWKVNLTRSFIALSTSRYYRWEEFKQKLDLPLDALIGVYSPTHFSRVGLRYVDVIKRSDLNLADVPWHELLQPYILGVLGSASVATQVEACESGCEIRLSDGESMVRLLTKLTSVDDEASFVVDSDFYNTSKTKVDEALTRLDFFNTRASRLIQWCITERLHEAMEPQQL